MKKIAVVGTLLASLLGFTPATAQANAAVDAALALGAFAVFNQFITGFGLFAPFWGYPAYYQAPYSYPYEYYGYPYGYGYYGSPYYRSVYYAPTTHYAPATSTPAHAAPASTSVPAQGEVVYAHGRYVLTGDGVTVAYQWVWVPNPPAGMPPAPPGSGR